jgi:hypothetical protein
MEDTGSRTANVYHELREVFGEYLVSLQTGEQGHLKDAREELQDLAYSLLSFFGV